ncbi:hypothetical protein ACHAP5_007985 [Fusarium lateritium]
MSSSSEDEGDLSSELDFAPRPTRQSSLQENSPFFTKLNYDIRLQIYREVFGFTRIHIIAPVIKMPGTIQRRWTHAICEEEFCEPWDPCYPQAYYGGSPCMLEVNCLEIDFLRACSRTFNEGIGVLHHSNTFVFGEPLEYINFMQIFHTPITSAHFGYTSLAQERTVLQLDLLTWALDAWALNPWTQLTKIKLSVCTDFVNPSLDRSGPHIMMSKALERFLSLRFSKIAIRMPFMWEEIRELVEKSGSHISFEFDPIPAEDSSLLEFEVTGQEGSENNSEGESGEGSQSEEV